MRNSTASLTMSLLLFLTGNSVNAQVQPVGPFEGERSDGFETYGMLFEQSIDFFEDAVTVSTTFPGPSVFVLFSSTFNSVTVTPHTGGWFMGVGAPAIWNFHTPVQKFGGYFATNSGGADATVEFFDTNDDLIATTIARINVISPSWTWNGWTSSVPIARIKMTGNGTGGGFIDFDDAQLTFADEPQPPQAVPFASAGAYAALACILFVAGARRVRRGDAGRPSV